MEYKNINFRTEKNISFIEINRPEVLNALNKDTVIEIEKALDEIRSDKTVKTLIVSGSGKNFAAGADIGGMADHTVLEAKEFTFNRAFNALQDLPVPVIAAVSGFALGGGLELALTCDFRICGKDAKMGMPEIKLGIFPGAGGTQRLPALIGPARAKMMIFLGNPIDADTAFQWGLCDIVTDKNPIEEAVILAEKLAERPSAALSQCKKVINYGCYRNQREGIIYEEESWAALFATDDQKEGMKAFLEKRKPVFKGR